MTDEKFVFVQDVREKKHTARSAFNRKTHAGKGGTVKLPSDYLSRKEIEAMNGKVEFYRLNDPMKWHEYKTVPDDLKKMYLEAIRKKYNTPFSVIAEMLGISRQHFSRETRRLGVADGRHAAKKWDKDGFYAWVNGAPVPKHEEAMSDVEAEEEPPEKYTASLEDISEPDPVHAPEFKTLPVRDEKSKAIPRSGSMTFEGRVEEVLNTVAVLLGGANVRLSVSWELVGGAEDGK